MEEYRERWKKGRSAVVFLQFDEWRRLHSENASGSMSKPGATKPGMSSEADLRQKASSVTSPEGLIPLFSLPTLLSHPLPSFLASLRSRHLKSN